MPETKHYVYSARTTERGLTLLNKAKGDRSWDAFVNGAVCAHYNLDPATVSLPPSKFLTEREEKRKAKEAEKAKKAAEKRFKEKGKKAAEKKAKE